jgi:hypothetical protein
MKLDYQKKIIINKNLLLCSLLTILPDPEVFKLVNKKENNEYFYHDLATSLNNPSLRPIASIILAPLLQKFDKISSQNSLKGFEIEITKQYLKKYNYIYSRYFFKNSENTNNKCDPKKINYYAVASLLLISGL